MSTRRGICRYIVINEMSVLIIDAISISQANPSKMTAEFCKNTLIPNAVIQSAGGLQIFRAKPFTPFTENAQQKISCEDWYSGKLYG